MKILGILVLDQKANLILATPSIKKETILDQITLVESKISSSIDIPEHVKYNNLHYYILNTSTNDDNKVLVILSDEIITLRCLHKIFNKIEAAANNIQIDSSLYEKKCCENKLIKILTYSKRVDLSFAKLRLFNSYLNKDVVLSQSKMSPKNRENPTFVL